MDAATLGPDDPLPTDVPSLHALLRQVLAEVAHLRAENAELRGQLDALQRRLGRRSERRPAPRIDPKGSPVKAPATRHGRAPLPEHLERREVVHDLSEQEKLCPCCGRMRICIGVQTAEQLELEPIRFFVLRTIKKSYVCPSCEPDEVPAEQRLQSAAPAQGGRLVQRLKSRTTGWR